MSSREAFQISKKQNIESIIQNIQADVDPFVKLFGREIQISIAYCDSLFEAGVFNRLEADRVKNALLTILKRAEFDKNYFDKSNGQNIYQFIDKKLVHLIGQLGSKIQIGRGYFERNSTVLRYWLREEIAEISDILGSIQRVFIKLAETNEKQIFLNKIADQSNQPILFSHWCLANFEALKRDRERLDEVWRRMNSMPLGSFNGIGTSLEFDREELAKKLGFQRITINSLDAVRNLDFLIEFANVSTIISTHFSLLMNELTRYAAANYFKFDIKIESENLILIKANLSKVFKYQIELQNNVQSESIKFNKKYNGSTNAINGCVSVLKNCLTAIELGFDSLRLNTNTIGNDLNNLLPCKIEIFGYLVLRDESFENADLHSTQIHNLIKSNKTLENTSLEDLQNISSLVESDIFDELSLESIISQKNQIGGTSYERVSEALDDAKRFLQLEE